jgi:LEA14-like dessication related protein
VWERAYSLIIRRKRTVAVIIVAIVIVAAGVAAYFSSSQPPQIESVKISSIDRISLSGLNLTFSIKIYNPNIVSMTIKNITYNLMLAQTNQLLMNGSTGEINIPAHGSTEIFIKSTVYFAPAISLAFMTIFTKSVMMELSGGGTAPGLFSDHSFSFSRTFDAYPYISNQVSNVV